MEDIYYIPSNNGRGFYKEKASKFISYLFPVFDLNDIEHSLLEVKSEHPKARHFCYSYRLSPKENQFRINDDGEPSGTAGRPIYNQILSSNLHNVLVIVVRYFGGTKLGASGLIRAYKTATEEACKNTTIKEHYDTIKQKIYFDYAKMGTLINELKSLNITIKDKAFDEQPNLTVLLRMSIASLQIRSIKARLLGRSIEDVDSQTKVSGIVFESDKV